MIYINYDLKEGQGSQWMEAETIEFHGRKALIFPPGKSGIEMARKRINVVQGDRGNLPI